MVCAQPCLRAFDDDAQGCVVGRRGHLGISVLAPHPGHGGEAVAIDGRAHVLLVAVAVEQREGMHKREEFPHVVGCVGKWPF